MSRIPDANLKIDDAEHVFMDFERDRPNEEGGTHIGLFLSWAIRRGLANPALSAYKGALEAGETRGRAVLFDQCDGKLFVSDLNEQGGAFASDYYAQHYLHSYVQAFGLVDPTNDELADVPDDEASQRTVDAFLDIAVRDWRASLERPSRYAIFPRLLAALGPRIEAAGFVRLEHGEWHADAESADFARSGEGYQQIVRFMAFEQESQGVQHAGISVTLCVHLKPLGQVIYDESRIDLPQWTSAATPTARIALKALAVGWSGPLCRLSRFEGFEVQRLADLDPLLEWLSARMSDFALPILRRIESVETLVKYFDRVPLTRSPLWLGYWDYSVPLAFEQARHPRLDDVLVEIERNQPPSPDSTRTAMTALIGRIRARETVRRADAAKQGGGFWRRLFPRG